MSVNPRRKKTVILRPPVRMAHGTPVSEFRWDGACVSGGASNSTHLDDCEPAAEQDSRVNRRFWAL